MIRLTGKEQLTALDVVRRRALDEYVTPDRAQEDDALCDAQIKKVVEYIRVNSMVELVVPFGQSTVIKWKDWQALLEEVRG